MEIKTLTHTSIASILDTFNSSFSDYSIPFELNEKQLRSKISSENIDLNYSIGAFEDSSLIGFILHGARCIDGEWRLYNGGTSVIPSKRGNRITSKMYDYIIPKLHENNIKSVQLEVISDNEPAIRTYKKTGFQLVRKLNCYKGTIKLKQHNSDVVIHKIKPTELSPLTQFWDFEPTWQNSMESVLGMHNDISIFSALSSKETVGYLVINKTSNRIIQISTSKLHRRKHIGSALIKYVDENCAKQTSIINIDNNNKATNLFFIECGLERYLQQDEMILRLTQ